MEQDSLPIYYLNDLKNIDKHEVFQTVRESSNLSLSYIVLLTSSTVVCTLGLLLNTPAVIIGGMIISPLMWPLVKIAVGITYEMKPYVKQAILLLLFSVLITLASSFLITFISPLKLVNSEILARTNPTLLDIFIALAAGAVATVAVSNKKISNNLAGVAIATSLMPPLCVAGIGLAIFEIEIFVGGFMLFFANVISIIFISILTFLLLGIKRTHETSFRFKGVAFITAALLVTVIPLFVFLKDFSFKANAYHDVKKILSQSLKQVSPSIYVQNVKTSLAGSSKNHKFTIEADVLVPDGLAINFNQQKQVIEDLEKAFNAKVDLKLRIQPTLSLLSEEDISISNRKQLLSDTFQEEIKKVDSTFSIDSFNASFNPEKNHWTLDVVLRGDPSIQFSNENRLEIENLLAGKVNQTLSLNLDIVSRIQLKSQPDVENEMIKQDIRKMLTQDSRYVDIASISLQNKDFGQLYMVVIIELKIPQGYELSPSTWIELKNVLEEKYQRKFSFQINLFEKNMMWY
jgi:uncharacterized hydrophobic protein (TIGR00271 family)